MHAKALIENDREVESFRKFLDTAQRIQIEFNFDEGSLQFFDPTYPSFRVTIYMEDADENVEHDGDPSGDPGSGDGPAA